MVAMTGILSITALEITAILMKIDGQYMSIVVGAIAAIVGGVVGIKVAQARATKSAAEA